MDRMCVHTNRDYLSEVETIVQGHRQWDTGKQFSRLADVKASDMRAAFVVNMLNSAIVCIIRNTS